MSCYLILLYCIYCKHAIYLSIYLSIHPFIHPSIHPSIHLSKLESLVLFPPQIALGECYRVRYRGVHSRAFVRNCYVSCLYKELGSFLFGCCVGQSLTNMAKLSVGRLRPNFLDVCKVTYASINCTLGSYVPKVSCQQPNEKMVEEARCVCVHVYTLDRFGLLTKGGIYISLSHAVNVYPFIDLSLSGSLFFPAMLPLQCTPCSTWQ